jgi:hypothetical protein
MKDRFKLTEHMLAMVRPSASNAADRCFTAAALRRGSAARPDQAAPRRAGRLLPSGSELYAAAPLWTISCAMIFTACSAN